MSEFQAISAHASRSERGTNSKARAHAHPQDHHGVVCLGHDGTQVDISFPWSLAHTPRHHVRGFLCRLASPWKSTHSVCDAEELRFLVEEYAVLVLLPDLADV